MINPALFSSDKTEWATPQSFFDKLNEEFHFTLDAAASKENAKCERYYSKEDDALTKEWAASVWLNPPYGRDVGRWVAKAHHENQHQAETVVCLLPARTDTDWWHRYVIGKAAEIRFVRGRLKFEGATNSAPFPSVVVIFRWGRTGENVITAMRA